MRLSLPAVALLLSSGARAHVADEIVVAWNEASRTQTLTMTADTLAMLAPVDADADGELTQADLDARADAIRAGVWEQARLQGCSRSNERASIEPGYVALTARFDCPRGELTQDFRLLLVLPPNYRVVYGNQAARGELTTLHLGGVAMGEAAGEGLRWWIPAGAAGAVALVVVGMWLVRRRRR